MSPSGASTKKTLANILKGEAAIAPAGLVVAFVMLLMVAGTVWWATVNTRREVEAARLRDVNAAATIMSGAAESMLAVDQPESLRRLVLDTANERGYLKARVVLGNERVIADRDAAVSYLRKLPTDPWPAIPEKNAHAARLEGNIVSIARIVEIPGRGPVLVEIDGVIDYPGWTGGRASLGFAALGVLGMMGLWIAYRGLRSRLRGVCAIGEALRACAAGEKSVDALRVAADFGAEALAWNELLDERGRLLDDLTVAKGGESQNGTPAERELSSVCDAMWQGMAILDQDMKIQYANGAAAVILGATREAVTGQRLDALITDQPVVDMVAQLAGGGVRQRSTVEVQRQGKGGQLDAVIRIGVRPVRRVGTAAALVILEDITQQRVADLARNAFVAQASHELRTPLTNIRLYAESLLETGETDPKASQKAINVINTESRRLERIVGDMLSVSEIEAGAFRLHKDDVRLQPIFEELEADFAVQAHDKEISLKFELPPKLPVLHGDRDKITLALHNIVGNALKYTPTGGKVDVRVNVQNPESPTQQLTVDVTDNGIGINPDECELIFEKFYRAKDGRVATITGSGLGLALARQVVRLHGGDINVKSQLDKGSTFTITLPAAA